MITAKKNYNMERKCQENTSVRKTKTKYSSSKKAAKLKSGKLAHDTCIAIHGHCIQGRQWIYLYFHA